MRLSVRQTFGCVLLPSRVSAAISLLRDGGALPAGEMTSISQINSMGHVVMSWFGEYLHAWYVSSQYRTLYTTTNKCVVCRCLEYINWAWIHIAATVLLLICFSAIDFIFKVSNSAVERMCWRLITQDPPSSLKRYYAFQSFCAFRADVIASSLRLLCTLCTLVPTGAINEEGCTTNITYITNFTSNWARSGGKISNEGSAY